MNVSVPSEVAALGPEAVDHYVRMIQDGQTERWALMAALQQPPGTKGTDRAFQQGRLDGNWMDDMPVHQAQKMVREAKASGISIAGKQYISGLADKRGHMDPMAWVSDTADVRAVAKARNLTVQGMVNHQGDEMPRKVTAISKRAAEKLAREEMKNRPGLKKGDALALVREKYSLKGKRKAQ